MKRNPNHTYSKHYKANFGCLIFGLIIVIALLISGCKKEKLPESGCWTCDVNYFNSAATYKVEGCGNTPTYFTDGNGNDLNFKCYPK